MAKRNDNMPESISPCRSVARALLGVLVSGLLGWQATPLVVSPAAAEPTITTPPTFDSRYRIEVGGLTIGELTRQLSEQNGRFVLETVSEATGLAALFMGRRIEESTEFVLDGSGRVQPLNYRYAMLGRKSRLRETHFDPELPGATGERDGQPWTLKVTQNEWPAYDPLAYQVEMARDVASGERSPSYYVVLKGKLLHYQFDLAAEEPVTAGDKSYDTLKFVRRTEPPEVTEIWIAPALGYQPVQVRVTDDDRTTTRVYLEEFNPTTGPTTATAAGPEAGAGD